VSFGEKARAIVRAVMSVRASVQVWEVNVGIACSAGRVMRVWNCS
jgi:hypothetical protein